MITYMRGGEEVGIVGDDGNLCAVIACLVKHPILEHHKYIWILFKSGVKVPIVALRLRGGAVKPLGNISLVLLQMDGLIFIERSSGSGMSRAEELGTYSARRTVHGISFSVRDAQELLFLTLEQFGQYFG